MPYSWIAVLVLAGLLAGSGLILKGQIETNGELKQSLHETNAALERVAAVVKEQEADKQRLSDILAKREEVIRESSKAVSKGQDVIRVESVKPTTFGRCSDVLLPSDVVLGLRSGAGHRGADSQGTASGPSAERLPTP